MQRVRVESFVHSHRSARGQSNANTVRSARERRFLPSFIVKKPRRDSDDSPSHAFCYGCHASSSRDIGQPFVYLELDRSRGLAVIEATRRIIAYADLESPVFAFDHQKVCNGRRKSLMRLAVRRTRFANLPNPFKALDQTTNLRVGRSNRSGRAIFNDSDQALIVRRPGLRVPGRRIKHRIGTVFFVQIECRPSAMLWSNTTTAARDAANRMRSAIVRYQPESLRAPSG
jgi:hypothetical protein